MALAYKLYKMAGPARPVNFGRKAEQLSLPPVILLGLRRRGKAGRIPCDYLTHYCRRINGPTPK